MEMESETQLSKFRRICVFCGSSQGKKSSYQDAAIELGRELVFNKKLWFFFFCFFGLLNKMRLVLVMVFVRNLFFTNMEEMGSPRNLLKVA